ncbi:MAG: hypothetical protein ACR2LR_02975 [Hassallia sp.]
MKFIGLVLPIVTTLSLFPTVATAGYERDCGYEKLTNYNPRTRNYETTREWVCRRKWQPTQNQTQNQTPIPNVRRPEEDQKTCISRISSMLLAADSYSETGKNFRYKRPHSVTPEQMKAAGLRNHGIDHINEMWRSPLPKISISLMSEQEAVIYCR